MTEDSRPVQPIGHRAVASNAAIGLVGAISGGGLVFVNEILAARFLGVEYYGLYGIAFALAKAGEILSMFGLRVGVLHFLPIQRSERRADLVAGTIYAAHLLPIVMGGLLGFLLWMLAPLVSDLVFDDAQAAPYIRMIAFAVPFMSLSEIQGNITRGFGHAAYYVLIRNIVAPVAFGCMVLALGSMDAPKEWITGALSGSYLLAFIVGSGTVAHVARQALFRVRPVMQLRQLYRYSFPILLNTFFYTIIGWTDLIMVGGYLSAADAGLYRACMQVVIVFEIVAVAFNAATSHVYPVLTKLSQHDELGKIYRNVVVWASILSLIAFLVIAFNAAGILAVLGPTFPVAAPALIILAFGQFTRSALGSGGFLLVVSGRQTVETVNAVVAAIANVALNLLMIPAFGIVGAAIATTASLVLLNAMRAFEASYFLRARMPLMPLIRIAATGCVLAVGFYLALGFEAAGPTGIVARVAVTGATSAAALWLFGMTRDDRRAALGVFGSREAKPI